MNSQQNNDNNSLSILAKLNSICDEFAVAWTEGKQPLIEEYLDSAEIDRATLLWRLLQVEWEILEAESNRPLEDDYMKRFHADRAVVESAYEAYCGKVDDTVEWRGADADSDTQEGSARGLPPISGRLAQYEILKLLGQGGFGAVFLAKDTNLERLVALKILREDRHDEFTKMESLLSEARTAAQLTHPNIISVFEAGSQGSVYYIATDYIRGHTLRAVGANLSEQEIVKLVKKLAAAIHHAHTKGIIHRDIKPANILIDEKGEPHIADFGLALWETMQSEEAGPIRLGTPAYMSPEQAKGESHLADARSDLWSLGVVLFELLTLRRPFQGPALEVMDAVCHVDAPSPRKFNSQISHDLAAICEKCLAREPANRYPSCQHLADELQLLLEGRPVSARPIGMPARIGRWCRRQPVVAGMLAAVVALAIFAGVSTNQRLRANLRAAELEQENARKENERLENAIKDSLFQDARTAEQLGQWALALDKAQQAIDAGHKDEVGLRLIRLRALTSEFQPNRYRLELSTLGKIVAADDPRLAEVLLENADIASFDGDHDRAVQLIQQASAIGLTDAQKSFAAGIQAKTVGKAIDHFQKSVDLDPLRVNAWAYLCSELVFSGQRKRAREACMVAHGRFPRHPAFVTLLTFLDACEDDTASLKRRLVWLKENTSGNYAGTMATAMDILDQIREMLDLSKPPKPFQLLGSAYALMQRRGGSFFTADLKFRLPLRLQEDFSGVISAYLGFASGVDIESMEKAIGKATQTRPEASLLLAHAALLERAGKEEEALVEFTRASNADAMFPECRRLALYGKARLLARRAHRKDDRTIWKQALVVAKERFPLGNISFPEAAKMAEIGMMAQDYEFAKRAANLAIEKNAKHRKVLEIKLLIAFHQNSFQETVNLANQILEIQPDSKLAADWKAKAERRIAALADVAKTEAAKPAEGTTP